MLLHFMIYFKSNFSINYECKGKDTIVCPTSCRLHSSIVILRENPALYHELYFRYDIPRDCMMCRYKKENETRTEIETSPRRTNP